MVDHCDLGPRILDVLGYHTRLALGIRSSDANGAAPRLLSLERFACKAGPQLASGNLRFGRIPLIPSPRRVAPCSQTVPMGFRLHTCFPS